MPSSSHAMRRRLIDGLTLGSMFVAGLFTAVISWGVEPVQQAANSVRVPWTTSRVVGSPDTPPPYKVVRAFPNLKFEKPLLMARCPGSDRLFVGEQAGRLYWFVNKPDANADLFLDLKNELTTIQQLPHARGVEALYGLVFHPEFEKNRQCFVCYTLSGTGRNQRNLAD